MLQWFLQGLSPLGCKFQPTDALLPSIVVPAQMSSRRVAEGMFDNSFPSRSLSSELLQDRDCGYRILNQVDAQEGFLKTWAPGDCGYLVSVLDGTWEDKGVVGGYVLVEPTRQCALGHLLETLVTGLCQPPGFAGWVPALIMSVI